MIQEGLKLNQPYIETSNPEWQQLKAIFEVIQEILDKTDIETDFYQYLLNELQVSQEAKISRPRAQRLWHTARQRLRFVISRDLLNLKYRELAIRLADSALLQSFCLIQPERDPANQFGTILRTPGKSTLHEYETQIPERIIRQLNTKVIQVSTCKDCSEKDAWFEEMEPVDLKHLYLDTTCLEANIHYPVDWVLFRDAIRTMILGILQIRKLGIKNRMPDPKQFIRDINKKCIEMTQASRGRDSRKRRKKVLREMKKLLTVVANHAQNYYEILKEKRDAGHFNSGFCNQILFRLEDVLLLIPKIKHQAHERIIGHRPVESEDKVLSIYDTEIYVMNRKKSGKPVEIGNALSICEQALGLVVDWRLYRTLPSDSTDVLPDTLHSLQSEFDLKSGFSINTDRGFDSATNRERLEKDSIINGLCPRSVVSLKNRLSDAEFVEHQKRRAQTESRIAILKQTFLQHAVFAKGFENRERAVAWGILSHNLWVLARKLIAERKKKSTELQAA